MVVSGMPWSVVDATEGQGSEVPGPASEGEDSDDGLLLVDAAPSGAHPTVTAATRVTVTAVTLARID